MYTKVYISAFQPTIMNEECDAKRPHAVFKDEKHVMKIFISIN